MELDVGWIFIALGALGWLAAILLPRRRGRSIQAGRDISGVAVAGDVRGGIQQGGSAASPPATPAPEEKKAEKDWWSRSETVIKLVASLVALAGAVIKLLGD